MNFKYEEWQKDILHRVYPGNSMVDQRITADEAAMAEGKFVNIPQKLFTAIALDGRDNIEDLQSLIKYAEDIKMDIQDIAAVTMSEAAAVRNWSVVSFLLNNGFDFNVSTPCPGLKEDTSAFEIIINFAPEQVRDQLQTQIGSPDIINMVIASTKGPIDLLEASIKQLKSMLESKQIVNGKYYNSLTNSLLIAATIKGKEDLYINDLNNLMVTLIAAGADVSKVKPIKEFLRDKLSWRDEFFLYESFIKPAIKYVDRDLKVFFKSIIKVLIVNEDGGTVIDKYQIDWLYDIILQHEGKNLEVMSALTNALVELHNELKANGVTNHILSHQIKYFQEHMNPAPPSLADRFFDAILSLFRFVGNVVMQLFSNKSSNDINNDEKISAEKEPDQKLKENNSKFNLDKDKLTTLLMSVCSPNDSSRIATSNPTPSVKPKPPKNNKV